MTCFNTDTGKHSVEVTKTVRSVMLTIHYAIDLTSTIHY